MMPTQPFLPGSVVERKAALRTNFCIQSQKKKHQSVQHKRMRAGIKKKSLDYVGQKIGTSRGPSKVKKFFSQVS